MNRILVFLLLVGNWSIAAHSQQINRYEYWFNQQPQQITDIAAVHNASLNMNLNTDILPDGLNSFSIRFRDNNNLWSAVLTRFFVKLPVLKAGNNSIVAYEYRFNQDAAVHQTVAAAVDVSIDEVMAAKDLPDGLNSFSIRFKDHNGLWSAVLTRFFVKFPVEEGANNELRTCQLWFNDDYQQVQNTPIESGATFQLLDTLSVADLPDGLHRVHVRFRDNNGLWSPVISRFFVKNPVYDAPEANMMTAYEYWLEDPLGNTLDADGNPGRSSITLDEPVNPMLLDLNLDMRRIPKGNYHLLFRFLDTRGIWSGVLAREIEKISLPVAHLSMDVSALCGTGTVAFSNLSIDTDTWHWDFGDGNTSDAYEAEHHYSAEGEYTVTLTASDSATGVESMMETVVKVHPDYEFTQTHYFYKGVPFSWQGNEYDAEGEYRMHYQSTHGCDSVYVLVLIEDPFSHVGVDGLPVTAKVYPNPAGDHVYLVLEKELNDFNIVVRSITGEMIYSVKSLSGNTVRVPLSGVTPGVYLLEIQYEGYRRRVKFVVN